jgi:hypothetical protein
MRRILACIVYGLAALLLINWAIYLETLSEASQGPVAIGTYWVALSGLIFAIAAVTSLIRQRPGVIIGALGGVIGLPFCLLEMLKGSWKFRLSEYELTVAGAIIMVAIAFITSYLLLKRQKAGAKLSQS